MSLEQLRGVGTALITPFTRGGEIDVETLQILVKRQIAGGVDMLVPCGTTGEAVTMTDSEYESVIGTVVDAADGQVVVLGGAGSNSTQRSIELGHIAKVCGVDGLLIVGPYYNKPTQEGFYQHYRSVSESLQHPIVLYNVPGRTGSNISGQTQLRIAELEWLVGTKEASGNFSQQMEIIEGRPPGFSVLSGDDNLALAQCAFGMDGVISVISNEMPQEFSSMIHAALAGDFAAARKIHYNLLHLMELNFIESSPIPVKTAMAMMGLITESFRLPLVPMSPANKEQLREALLELKLVR